MEENKGSTIDEGVITLLVLLSPVFLAMIITPIYYFRAEIIAAVAWAIERLPGYK